MVRGGGLADAPTMTTATAPLPPEPPVQKRLTRSSGDRVIAGVGGGLGKYIGIDPVVVRLVFIVTAFFGGAGVIAYAAAWLLVPSDADGAAHSAGKRLGKLLGVATLTFLAAAAGFWGFAIGGGVPTALVIIAIGVMLAVAAFTGGLRWLILPAVAMALTAGTAAAAGLDIRGGMGERIYQPVSADTIRPEYKLGVGHLRLDLRNTDFSSGTTRVQIKLGVGQAEVLVPADVCVSSTAHISVGDTTVFDRNSGGIDLDWVDDREAAKGKARLIVDGDVGIGQLRIERKEYGESAGNEACSG